MTFASGSCGFVHSLFDVFFLTVAVQSRQVFPCRRLNPRRLGEPRQKLLIALSRIAAHDAAHRGIGLERRGIDRHGLAAEQARFRQPLLNPREDRPMGVEIDQPSRARNRRVIGRRFIQRQVQELANRERVRRAPSDAALRVDALEVAHQQQPEVHAGRQTGTAHRLGVKRPARPLDELVERLRVEHRVHASVKWVRGRRGQIGGGYPEVMLTSPLASSAHCHRQQCSTWDRSCRSPHERLYDFSHGLLRLVTVRNSRSGQRRDSLMGRESRSLALPYPLTRGERGSRYGLDPFGKAARPRR